MVVSRDWAEVSVLECILGGLHIGVDVEPEPARARAKLAKSKVDALIVDCDLDGTTSFLRSLEKGVNAVPLVIVSGSNGHTHLADPVATFVFKKPISVEQAVRTLSAARNMILDGRLRYHRAGLDVPVTLRGKRQKHFGAQLINLSQGGLQVHVDDGFDARDLLRASFELPGTKSSVKADVEVAWSDDRGNVGIRFVKIPGSMQHTLRVWLAQQYFAN